MLVSPLDDIVPSLAESPVEPVEYLRPRLGRGCSALTSFDCGSLTSAAPRRQATERNGKKGSALARSPEECER